MLLLTNRAGPTFEERVCEFAIEHDQPEYPFRDEIHRDIRHLLVGRGHFSSVWAVPGEPFTVLKVSHRETDACRHYLRWVKDHPHPNAPEIFSIDYHEHLMLVKMRRYEPFDADVMCFDKIPGYQVLMRGRTPDHKLGHEQLCASIRRNFKDFRFDLHGENIMLDRAGNIIITDPVSYSRGDY